MAEIIEHKIDDLKSIELWIRKNLEYAKDKIGEKEIEERVKSGIEEYINDHIRRNIEREVMADIGYGVYLFDNYMYNIKEKDDIQNISINIEYTRLSEKRVGDTWGFEIKRERKSKEFEFEVKKIPKEIILRYTIERKL